jgi:hypothetical protein
VRRTLPLLALGLLLAAPSGASAAKSTVKACETAGRSLDGNALVRLAETSGRLVACSLENGRRRFVGNRWISSQHHADVQPLALAGRMVLAHRWYCDYHTCDRTRLEIFDMRSGTTRLVREPEYPGVVEAVLAPGGSAAWIESDVRGNRTLHRLDSGGETVVAAGDVRDLALSERGTLYWSEAGVTRSATLEPIDPQARPQERRPRCGTRLGTIAVNPWARVHEPDAGLYEACSAETGRGHHLGETVASPSGEERVGPFALSRRLVAYYAASCGGDPFGCSPNAIHLLDARSGKRRTVARVPDIYDVEELLLTRSGSVAFAGPSVHIADRRGQRAVGSGADLALSKRSVVYWTAPGGAPASAPIE